MKNTIMKNLKLIKKQDFGQTEYSSIGQETLTTQHYFTLEQKDGYILDAKIVKVVTDLSSTLQKISIIFCAINISSLSPACTFKYF